MLTQFTVAARETSPLRPLATPSPRDRRYNRSSGLARWYLAGDPVATAFFNALSSTFPLGERFFADSVRPFRDAAPPALSVQIGAFIQQEALHGREHVVFNDLVARAGYETHRLTERTVDVLAPFRARPGLRALGLTIALEHFTALFAVEVLTREVLLAGASPETRGLWRWHAAEEIEHKAVAFDTFLWAARDRSPAWRWLFRARAMLEGTVVLASAVGRNMHDLHRQDGLPPGRTWLATARHLIGPGGVLSPMVGGYLAWFLPGFHPWRRDDAALAALALSERLPPAA